VFPGSALTSIGAIGTALAATDFRLTALDDFSADYARTLRCWREAFMSRLDAVRELGYDQRFVRLWEFYLAYCEAGFEERTTGVVQLRLERPMARPRGTANGIN
jgi:cyclopropane-fatty-acyl-phospholipid synthase